MAKTVNGATTSYAWDPTGLGTVLSGGAEYVWGNGLVSQVAASATTYVQSDGLGSIRLLTDASGAVTGRQQYDAYGAGRAASGVQLPFGYTGEQTDPESGLVYLRARYMDPSTGRFLSRDSVPQGNRFAYAGDAPTRYTDPSGHCIGPLLALCIAWGVAEAAPLLLAIGSAIVASPVLIAVLSDQIQGAQDNIDTLLCPDLSADDRTGAAIGLGLAALSLTPEGGAAADIRLAADLSWGKLATLVDHFVRHGGNFGATSSEEYARQASSFLQRSQREGLQTKIDS